MNKKIAALDATLCILLIASIVGNIMFFNQFNGTKQTVLKLQEQVKDSTTKLSNEQSELLGVQTDITKAKQLVAEKAAAAKAAAEAKAKAAAAAAAKAKADAEAKSKLNSSSSRNSYHHSYYNGSSSHKTTGGNSGTKTGSSTGSSDNSRIYELFGGGELSTNDNGAEDGTLS